MTCRKDAPDLPLCSCKDCDEERRARSRWVFIHQTNEDFEKDFADYRIETELGGSALNFRNNLNGEPV